MDGSMPAKMSRFAHLGLKLALSDGYYMYILVPVALPDAK